MWFAGPRRLRTLLRAGRGEPSPENPKSSRTAARPGRGAFSGRAALGPRPGDRTEGRAGRPMSPAPGPAMPRFAPLFALLLAAGPAAAADDDLAARAKEVFRGHCAECHGPTKARAGVNVLDRD